MRDIRGRVAFVTGGASGIGLGIAAACLDAGMSVAIADVRDDHLATAVKELGAAPGTLHAMRLDVADRQGRTAMTWAQGVFLATHPPEVKPQTIALLKQLQGGAS